MPALLSFVMKCDDGSFMATTGDLWRYSTPLTNEELAEFGLKRIENYELKMTEIKKPKIVQIATIIDDSTEGLYALFDNGRIALYNVSCAEWFAVKEPPADLLKN